jgi:hypothetical protein
MFLLEDILTYIRRIIKTPSNAVVSDDLLIDYVNRFWIADVDARLQVFDLKTKYQFQTQPGVDQYNMPLYNVQTEPGNQSIGSYPVYQGFLGPCYINGVEVSFQTQKSLFFNAYPNVTQNLGVVAIGNGTSGPYTLQFPILPSTAPPNPPLSGILRGHIDISGIIATGANQDPPVVSNFLTTVPVTSVKPAVYITTIGSDGSNVVVADSGQFLQGNINYGLLMTPGNAPFGNTGLPNGGSLVTPYATTQNTVNYFTGTVTNLYFPVSIPSGNNISVQCQYFQSGLPRSILFYNNTLTLRSPPDTQYLVELDAYLSPAAFLNTDAAIPFGYMSEYIARGAARKILSDTGDIEQFQFYEPFFREQELLVWKRSQRQWTSTRTETIYSRGNGMGNNLGYNQMGGTL